MGAMATTPITAVFTATFRCANARWAGCWSRWGCFGAEYTARAGGLMPVTLQGAARPICVEHKVAVASAQVNRRCCWRR